jgi:hypothetical protein
MVETDEANGRYPTLKVITVAGPGAMGGQVIYRLQSQRGPAHGASCIAAEAYPLIGRSRRRDETPLRVNETADVSR